MTTHERLALTHRTNLKHALTFRKMRNTARARGDERAAGIAHDRSEHHKRKATEALEELRRLEDGNRVPLAT
jgi:hypothetical protein